MAPSAVAGVTQPPSVRPRSVVDLLGVALHKGTVAAISLEIRLEIWDIHISVLKKHAGSLVVAVR